MQKVRAARGWHIWLGVAASMGVMVGGCASDVGTSVERIDEARFEALEPDAELWVDLSDPSRGALFDRAAQSLDRVVLVCPNGQAMRYETWSAGQDLSEVESRFIAVGLDEVILRDAIAELANEQEDCQPTCFTCTDGAVICSGCGAATDAHTEAGFVDPRWLGGGTLEPYAPPDPTDPGDDPPPSFDPGTSGGGSGGSGEGGGSSGGGSGSSGGSGGGHSGSGGHSGGGGGHSGGGGGHPGW